MTAPARTPAPPRHQALRAVGVLGPPVLALTHLSAVYALVPTACSSGAGEAATAAATGLAAALVVACGVLARRLHARAGRDAGTDREAQVDALLGQVGQMLAALFLLVVLGIGLGAAMVDACTS